VQLTKLNLAAQQSERELRDELADVVPKSVSDADRKKLSACEEDLAKAAVRFFGGYPKSLLPLTVASR